MPFAIWSAVYATVWGEPVENFRNLLLNFNYSAGHLWFIYMLIGIYLLMPLLSPWAEKVEKKELLAYLGIWAFTTLIPLIRDWAAGGATTVIYGPSGLPRQALYPLWGEASWNAYGVFYYMSGFIGYLLLFHGLFHTSFLSDQLRQARDLIWKLALITAVRAVSVVFLPYTSDTFTLLLVFIFAVLETMYALPAIAAIFEGAYAVGTRLDCESIYDVVHKEKRTPRGTVSVQIERAERLKIFTVVFFLLKTVAAVLPELTALQLADDLSGDSRWKLPLAAYRPWMYVLLGLLVLVVGIV